MKRYFAYKTNPENMYLSNTSRITVTSVPKVQTVAAYMRCWATSLLRMARLACSITLG